MWVTGNQRMWSDFLDFLRNVNQDSEMHVQILRDACEERAPKVSGRTYLDETKCQFLFYERGLDTNDSSRYV